MATKRKSAPRPGNGGARIAGPGKALGPPVKHADFTKDDARTLRTVLLARYGKANQETVNAWVAGLIRQEWADYDAMIQQLADEMTELT